MKIGNALLLFSVFLALMAIPLTLAAVKISQDNRSQAMTEHSPLPAIPPLDRPTPTPTPK